MTTTHARHGQTDRPLREADEVLSAALREQVTQAWGHRGLVVRHAIDPTAAATWFSEQDVLDHLASPMFLEQQLVLLRDKTQAGNHAAVNRADVLVSVRQGSSIQIRHLEAFLPRSHAIPRLAEELELATGHAVDSVTLFLTPPGEQALPRHEDASDVYALQLSGEKHWEIDIDSCRLGPGDLAYIPAHTEHEVRQVGEQVSVSLAFVMRAVSFREILHARLDEVLGELGRAPRVPALGSVQDAWRDEPALGHYLATVLDHMSVTGPLTDMLMRTVLDHRLPPRMGQDGPAERYIGDPSRSWIVERADHIEVRVAGAGRFTGPPELRALVGALVGATDPVELSELEHDLPLDRARELAEVLCDIGAVVRLPSVTGSGEA